MFQTQYKSEFEEVPKYKKDELYNVEEENFICIKYFNIYIYIIMCVDR